MSITVVYTNTDEGLDPYDFSLFTLKIGVFTGNDADNQSWSSDSNLYVTTSRDGELDKLNLHTLEETSVTFQQAQTEIEDFIDAVDVYKGHNLIYDVDFLEANAILENFRLRRNQSDTKSLEFPLLDADKLSTINNIFRSALTYFNIDPDKATLLKYFSVNPDTEHNTSNDVLSTYKLDLKPSEL